MLDSVCYWMFCVSLESKSLHIRLPKRANRERTVVQVTKPDKPKLIAASPHRKR